MRAVWCSEPQDDLSTTTVTDVDLPKVGPRDVRVSVKAASLNPVDWKLCSGTERWWSGPSLVGLDAAGVIESVGDQVSGWQAGDRVVWHANLFETGVFAEYASTPAHVLSRIPDTVSFAEAAALPCAGYTAYQALIRKARLSAGDVVVIQGATGGAGGFAIQIAKAVGAKVIALVREEEFDWAKSLSADMQLDYRSDDLPARVRMLNDGEGADVFFEVVRPSDARQSLDMLRYNGQLVTIDPLPDLSHTPAYTYAASIHEVALGGAYGAGHIASQQDFAVMGDAMLRWLQDGSINSMITERIKLDDIPDALKRLRARQVKGKIVAEI